MIRGTWAARRPAETAIGLCTLVLSSGTLVCCALPILLVSVSLGASLAALTSAAPWLVALSAHKAWMFAGSAAALAAAVWIHQRPGRGCPHEPRLAAICARADCWNRRLLAASGAIWMVGFGTAYLWLPVRNWFGA